MKKDISIVLSGEAGQGIQTIEAIFAKLVKRSGYNVYATKEYMSRVRGGNNTTSIRVSSERVSAYVNRIDILVPLGTGGAIRIKNRLSPETIIIGEKESLAEYKTGKLVEVDFSGIALKSGNKIYSNTVAVGVLSALLNIDPAFLSGFIGNYFVSKGKEVADKNIEAAAAGFQAGAKLKLNLEIRKDEKVKDDIVISGAEAAALGAIGGGMNFLSAYPMTPLTGIFTFISQHAHEFGIVSEQAEDEISAINMAIGAWYAGARGMVTTSGGGYALMVEGISLAGMLETPVVVFLGQRPGPATGLPTRTEQGDLNFALYSGHGEFPRILLAPGTIEDTFLLSAAAFDLADKYQSPVFVLFDQYLADSYYNLPSLDLAKVKAENQFIRTGAGYKRYALTADGISPRHTGQWRGFGRGR